MPAEG